MDTLKVAKNVLCELFTSQLCDSSKCLQFSPSNTLPVYNGSFPIPPWLPILTSVPEGQVMPWTMEKNLKFLQGLFPGSFISSSQTSGPN